MAIADTIQSMYENVGEVYDTITNVNVNTGKNLFDISTITENTYIDENGNTGSSQVTNLSDYIELKPNTSYTLSYGYSTLLNSNQRNFAYYDSNKNFVGNFTYLPANKVNTITTPNNAKYIRFSYDKNCYSIMLNEGSTSLPYEPYTDTPTYKNIENIPKVIRSSYLEIMNNGIDKIWNNWEKVTGEGETLTLNGTEEAPMKINLKGNTSQETTTGKNLMPSDAIAGNTYNGIAVTLVNGKLHFQGSASAEYFAGSNITLPTHLLTTKQYYFKAISNCPSPTKFKIWGYNSSNVLKANISQDRYFTPEEEIVKYKIVFENMTIGTSYNFDAQFQIEEGGSFTSYEPYTNGASPNPDYPQDIHVVSGDNTIKVEGKNLFDKNSQNIIPNKYLNDSGVETRDNSFSISDYIKVDANTVYSSQPFENKSACICFYNSSKTFLSSKRLTQIQPNFTTPNSCEYIRVSIVKEDIDKIQIEKGSQATTYTTYVSQSYPITLPEGMFLGWIPNTDYRDIIFQAKTGDTYYDSLDSTTKESLTYGKWYLNKQIGKVVFDGSENWAINTSYTYNVFYRTLDNYARISNTQTTYCEYYKGIENTAGIVDFGNNYNNSIGVRTANDNIKDIYISNNSITSASDFKTWLSTHNTDVYYVLANPTYTEITDTTLLSQLEAVKRSFNEQTNISQTNNDLPFILDVMALKQLTQ